MPKPQEPEPGRVESLTGTKRKAEEPAETNGDPAEKKAKNDAASAEATNGEGSAKKTARPKKEKKPAAPVGENGSEDPEAKDRPEPKRPPPTRSGADIYCISSTSNNSSLLSMVDSGLELVCNYLMDQGTGKLVFCQEGEFCFGALYLRISLRYTPAVHNLVGSNRYGTRRCKIMVCFELSHLYISLHGAWHPGTVLSERDCWCTAPANGSIFPCSCILIFKTEPDLRCSLPPSHKRHRFARPAFPRACHRTITTGKPTR